MSVSDENADDKAAITAKDNSDIARGAGANFFGFIVRLGSRLPFLVLAIALFGNELYGRYIFTITTVEICAAFAAFGFKRSLFKFIHDGDYVEHYSVEQIMLSAIVWSVIVGGIFTALIILCADLLAAAFDYPEMVKGLRALAPMVMVITALDVILAGTRATRKMRYEVIARSFIEPYVLLLTMLIFYFMGFTVYGLLMGYAVALSTALIYSVWGFCHLYSLEKISSTRPNFILMKRLARFSGPTAFHDLALLVFMRMDVYTVTYFFSETVLGVYNIAQQFATSVEKIYQSFYPILSPVLANNFIKKDFVTIEKQMIMVSRWILMIQSVLVILSIFYGEAVYSAILSTDADTDASFVALGAAILVFLMIGETINGGFGLADLPIIYRTPLFNPIISITMIPVYIALAYLFTQRMDFNAVGVAMALCTTYFMMNLIRVIMIQKLFGINLLKLRTLRVIFAAVFSAGIFKIIILYSPFNLLFGWGIAAGLPVLFLLYGTCLIIFAMEKSDIQTVRARFSSK